MSFDFDRIVDRRGTAALKWDIRENELPMWVADMEFETAPAVKEAIAERVSHGVFGYSIVPDEWYDAYISWWESRHHFRMEREGLIFCTGVIPALSSAVRKLTTPGENVLLMTPVYNTFFNSILNNGRNALESPLKLDGTTYAIDWEDLEKKLSNPQTTLLFLCNPHNPIGKIWERETLERIGVLAAKYGVVVIADEIHCDLCDPGKEYVPFASVSDVCRENSITCIAPSKTFNIAGLQSAAVYAGNPFLRHKIWRALNTDEVAEGNAFAVTAAVAAFTKGGEWLDALRAYLFENKQYVASQIKGRLPALTLIPSEATYLLWIDCRALPKGGADFAHFLRKETGLFLSAGRIYGKEGIGFVRMNIACPREMIREGMDRLYEGVRKYQETYG